MPGDRRALVFHTVVRGGMKGTGGQKNDGCLLTVGKGSCSVLRVGMTEGRAGYFQLHLSWACHDSLTWYSVFLMKKPGSNRPKVSKLGIGWAGFPGKATFPPPV